MAKTVAQLYQQTYGDVSSLRPVTAALSQLAGISKWMCTT
jgi:hypothetical protein